jgi:hypothetical protein
MRYDSLMKRTPEYEKFTGALNKLLQVSHEEIMAQLEAEKQQKKAQLRGKASDRASSAKD